MVLGMLFGGFVVFIVALILLSIIAFIWAIIDIVKSKKPTNWKILWVLICLLLGIIGVIVYYFVGRAKK